LVYVDAHAELSKKYGTSKPPVFIMMFSIYRAAPNTPDKREKLDQKIGKIW
jgi:hypothetical protein